MAECRQQKQNAPKSKVGKRFGKLVHTNCANDNRPDTNVIIGRFRLSAKWPIRLLANYWCISYILLHGMADNAIVKFTTVARNVRLLPVYML